MLAAAAAVAGCGSPAAAPQHRAPAAQVPADVVSPAAAAAYARAHRPAPVPGMTAGVLVSVTMSWTAGGPLAWTGVAVTASGQRITVTCDGLCGYRYTYSPLSPGDYAYWPSAGGRVATLAGIRVIHRGAVVA
jgi:hypothetical protein